MELIYGKHAVLTAVSKRPDCVRTVWADERHRTEPALASIKVEPLSPNITDKLPRDAVHQGIVANFDIEKLVVDFREWKHTLTDATPATCVVALGELTDPQNIGAIVRSAVAFGASAILIPEHRGAGITSTTIKVSVGTIFSIPIVQASNLNTALRDLKDQGFWVYGLESDGDTLLNKESFTRPSVFVVGNEGDGLRLKTREHCDTILNIPMKGPAESLNAATATAVALYVWSVNHG
jgi:23S rRNA (guanosine2251-2'-O)-methyltransferase